jgi:hypothetical protein
MAGALVSGVMLVLSAYLALGAVFALAYVTVGIGRVDPSAKGAPWTFRVLVFPGVAALWPLLLRLWLRSGGAR